MGEDCDGAHFWDNKSSRLLVVIALNYTTGIATTTERNGKKTRLGQLEIEITTKGDGGPDAVLCGGCGIWYSTFLYVDQFSII